MWYKQSLFIFILLISSLLAMSANSWFTAWMALEVNMLSFIPIIIKNNKLSNESSMKYFFIQTIASLIILMASSLNIFMYKQLSMEILNSQFMNPIISMALLMKMGAAPFHFWFPALMEGLKWDAAILLMTWQKLAPLTLNAMFSSSSKISMFSIMLSALVGAMGGINQTLLRKLLAYSSINHLSWLLLASLISESLMMLYFMMYTMIVYSLLMFMNTKNMTHFDQTLYWKFSKLNKSMFLLMILLSLGGLPPFMGFFPKWLLLNSALPYLYLLMSLFLVMMSILTLYYYVRLMISSFIMDYSIPMSYKMEKFNYLSYMVFINLTLLPILLMMS